MPSSKVHSELQGAPSGAYKHKPRKKPGRLSLRTESLSGGMGLPLGTSTSDALMKLLVTAHCGAARRVVWKGLTDYDLSPLSD